MTSNPFTENSLPMACLIWTSALAVPFSLMLWEYQRLTHQEKLLCFGVGCAMGFAALTLACVVLPAYLPSLLS